MGKRVLIGTLLLIGLVVFIVGISIRSRDIGGLINISSQGEKINLKAYPNDFYGLSNELDQYNVYLTGEGEGFGASYELNKYIGEYLIKNKGVKYILLNGGHSYAQFLNRYLETGDEKILQYIFENIGVDNKGNELVYPKGNGDEVELIKFYYNLNKGLDKDKKIKFVGIGSEHITVFALDYLKEMLKDKKIDPAIKPFIDKIKASDKGPRFFTEDINYYFRNHSNEIKDSLGNDYFDFKMVISNIRRAFEDGFYDNILVDNFKTQYANLPKGKYFGQMPAFHSDNMRNFDYSLTNSSVSTFAHTINVGFNQTRGKVFTLNYVYSKGKKLILNMPQDNQGLFAFPRLFGTSYKIYNSERDSNAFSTMKKWTKGKFADEWFIIVNNSPAANNYTGVFTQE